MGLLDPVSSINSRNDSCGLTETILKMNNLISHWGIWRKPSDAEILYSRKTNVHAHYETENHMLAIVTVYLSPWTFEQPYCFNSFFGNRKSLGLVFGKDEVNVCQFCYVKSRDPVGKRNSIMDGGGQGTRVSQMIQLCETYQRSER